MIIGSDTILMAQEGGQVWHERWGEDYDGEEGCVKWTDKVHTGAIRDRA